MTRQQDREEWVRLNTCRFCIGSHLHTCTGYRCEPAIKQAEEYFDKVVRMKMKQATDLTPFFTEQLKGNENSNTIEVVYLTTQPKTDLPTHCVIRSTGRISTVLCEQVHSVAVERVGNYIGQCTDKEMENIDIALMISLSLDAGIKTSKQYNETIKRQQEEIKSLKEEIEVMISDHEKKIEEIEQNAAVYVEEKTRVAAESPSENIIRIQTERDTYKALYESLLAKVMAS